MRSNPLPGLRPGQARDAVLAALEGLEREEFDASWSEIVGDLQLALIVHAQEGAQTLHAALTVAVGLPEVLPGLDQQALERAVLWLPRLAVYPPLDAEHFTQMLAQGWWRLKELVQHNVWTYLREREAVEIWMRGAAKLTPWLGKWIANRTRLEVQGGDGFTGLVRAYPGVVMALRRKDWTPATMELALAGDLVETLPELVAWELPELRAPGDVDEAKYRVVDKPRAIEMAREG
jgi:hypothetical protein